MKNTITLLLLCAINMSNATGGMAKSDEAKIKENIETLKGLGISESGERSIVLGAARIAGSFVAGKLSSLVSFGGSGSTYIYNDLNNYSFVLRKDQKILMSLWGLIDEIEINDDTISTTHGKMFVSKNPLYAAIIRKLGSDKAKDCIILGISNPNSKDADPFEFFVVLKLDPNDSLSTKIRACKLNVTLNNVLRKDFLKNAVIDTEKKTFSYRTVSNISLDENHDIPEQIHDHEKMTVFGKSVFIPNSLAALAKSSS